MIERYTREEMASIWSERAKYDLWLEIELAVCEALAQRGEIPAEAFASIRKKAGYDIRRIAQIEAEVHHDVIAFLTAVGEKIGPEARYLHLGMTSSDLIDTAFALQLVKAGKRIARDIDELRSVIERRAFEFKGTPMMGRSHGVHAEPITFGLKLAVWHDEFGRHAGRLARAIEGVAVGKISGAVGTFAHIDPEVERSVCAKLGLAPAPASTQVIQRDRHAHCFSVLAGIAASAEKAAVEIRHLQRTEVGEAAEPFGKGQKGSSAMPHKRNPILCENIAGLARLVRANAMAAFEDVALWHERDISHSSVERVIGPDSTILVDFMLARLAHILDGLEVFPDRMRENIDRSHGLFHSEGVMLALVRKGMSREEAYRKVQAIAIRSWREGTPFRELVAADAEVKGRLSEGELAELFDLKRYLKHIGAIFERVFGRH